MLWQPGVSVQVREMNQLQDYFQHQIEAMGDNLFSPGTIISGCNFQFYNPFPYVKINDLDVFNNIISPSSFVNYNVINENTGLNAIVTNFSDGLQTSDPDLKTLYLAYRNTGNNGSTQFLPGDTLTVYNAVVNPVQSVTVNGGGVNFNPVTDTVIFTSAVIVSANAVLANATYLINPVSGANLQIIGVDTNTYASSNQVLLNLAPRSVDLANSLANSTNWTASSGQIFTNPANTITVTINTIIGTGAAAFIKVNGIGTTTNVVMTAGGINYTVPPNVSIRSSNNTTGYASLNLQAQDYLTQVIVSSSSNSVGNGYGFGITQGVVYQKGYFLDVNPQQVIVTKYNQVPDGLSVGFVTDEQIVTPNIDQSLLDNVNSTQNEQAPGANRLQMIPTLMVVNTASTLSNTQFLSLVNWQAGQPFQQNQVTIYSKIGAEMAQRTEDASGNFVTDPFLATTRSPAFANQEGEFFNIVIDPGTAYIDGYRVSTVANFNINDEKGTDTVIAQNHTVSLNYGNYLICNNVAGVFQYNTGATVNLYNAPKGYYNNINNNLNLSPNLTPNGTLLGTASIRSLQLNSGIPGSGAATYSLYLYNIQMFSNAGGSFANVCSISYSNGSANVGIADIVLTQTAGGNVAVLQDPIDDTLLFYAGAQSLKNANNINYQYRTINTGLTISNGGVSNGTLVINISSGSNTFPFSGNLGTNDLRSLYVVPKSGVNLSFVNAISGNCSVTTTSQTVTGNSSSLYLSQLAVGDYIQIAANATGGADIHQVVGIANNISLTIDANSSFANSGAIITRVLPDAVPVPFGYRSGFTANVNNSENILTLDFGTGFSFSGSKSATVGFNVQGSNLTQTAKTSNRNAFVLICLANNAGGTNGPWCLGVPDVFRLDAVYIGSSAALANTGTNYINSFFVDHNQQTDYYGLSNLFLSPQANVNLTSSNYLLVQFDYFTNSGGFADILSYTGSSNSQVVFAQDAMSLSTLGINGVINTFEIPEVFTDNGTEIDLIQYLDFRPYAVATITPSAVYSTAPLNPNTTLSFSTSEKFFPVPDAQLTATIEYYIGRIDSVFVNNQGYFSVIKGVPNVNPALQIAPIQPASTMKIVDLQIPPYPNLSNNPSTIMAQILNNGIQNQNFIPTRDKNATISNLSSNSALPFIQPPVYTDADIGNIDRRLKNVEYITTLSGLELSTSQILVPSSVAPLTNRTTYGIFVDNFTTAALSAVNDPQYLATKLGTNIVPERMLWDLTLYGSGGPDWIEQPVASQPFATTGGITDPLGLGPVCALNLGNTVAYSLLYRNATDVETSANPFSNVDIVSLAFASQATVFESVQYVGASINDLITNNGLANYQDVGASATLATAISLVQQFGQASSSYDPASQTLTITDANHIVNGVPVTETLSGIPQSVADLFGSLLSGTIDVNTFLTQAASALGSTQLLSSVPSGGTFASNFYFPPVAFYFYSYDQGVKYEIFQNGTLIGSSDTTQISPISTPQALSTSDISLLTGPNADDWFNDNTTYFLQNFTDTGGGYVKYSGKILFNYNPANGSNFVIKATFSQNSYRWKYLLAYPINGASVGCVPPTPNITEAGNLNPVFGGGFTISAHCGNGANWQGQVNILTGFTETWNPITISPATSIVPFSAEQDWA